MNRQSDQYAASAAGSTMRPVQVDIRSRDGSRIPISGGIASGFEPVRDAFVANFEQGLEVGASVAVYREGELVVDLWGGHADAERQREWNADTVTLVYSVTKGATATLYNMLHELGALDLDRTVASYWPEFSEQGKQDITIRQLLSHQAGLPLIETALSRDELFDTPLPARRLAAQAPLWQPGTSRGYHAVTFGWLTGELMRRITGQTLGEIFAQRIAGPLDLSFWIGLPRERQAAFAPLVNGTPDPLELAKIENPEVRAAVERVTSALMDPTSLFARVLSTSGVLPTPDAATWNETRIIEAEQPGANGITNARSLARMYAACIGEIDGIRLFSDATLAEAAREQTSGDDEVLMSFSRFATGYQLPQPAVPMLGPSSFGHAGAGGALGFADRDAKIGFGYAQNLLGASIANEGRAKRLVDALKEAPS